MYLPFYIDLPKPKTRTWPNSPWFYLLRIWGGVPPPSAKYSLIPSHLKKFPQPNFCSLPTKGQFPPHWIKMFKLYSFDTQVMLILILIDVQYSQNAVFSFEKRFELSKSLVGQKSPQQNFQSPLWGRVVGELDNNLLRNPYRYLENPVPCLYEYCGII